MSRSVATCVAILVVTLLLTNTIKVVEAGTGAKAPWSFSNGSKIRLCYISPTDVDDLGWSFWHNKARIGAHTRILAVGSFAESNYDISSIWHPNFLQSANKTASLIEIIEKKQCNTVTSLSVSNYFGIDMTRIANMYPNVQFTHFSRPMMYAPSAPTVDNFAAFGTDIENAWYVLGAVAGAQAKTCVGFVYPLSRLSLGVNAFYRGMQSVGSTAKLFAAPLGSFYNPDGEVKFGELFLEKKCDVVLSWTDTRAAVELVNTRTRNEGLDDAFSIGYAADVATYTGDSVLSSLYMDIENMLFNQAEDYINGFYRTPELIKVGEGVVIASLSPLASRATAKARADALARIKNDDIFCSEIRNTANEVIKAAGTTDEACLRGSARAASFTDLEFGIEPLASFVSFKTCPAGSSYSYDLDTFVLSCTICPANTSSAEAGSASCTPCADGFRSEPNSTECTFIPSVRIVTTSDDDGFPSWAIAVIVVVIVLAIGIVVAVVVFAAHKKPNVLRSVATAPRSKNVALAMIGVDRAASDPSWKKTLDKMCLVYDAIAQVVERTSLQHPVYAFVSVGDVYMLACSNPEILYHALNAIVDECHGSNFPANVTLRVCCHYGAPTSIEVKTKDGSSKVNYQGPDVDLVRSMWGAPSISGKLCITSAFVTECAGVITPVPPLEKIKMGSSEVDVALIATKAPAGGSANISLVEEGCPSPQTPQSPAINPLNSSGVTALQQANTEVVQRNGSANSANETAVGDGFTSVAIKDAPTQQPAPKKKKKSGGETKTPSDEGSASTRSNTSEDADDDIQYLVPSSIISQDEIVKIRDFGAHFITSFIRVLAFQHQVEVVTAIAEKLHIRKPLVPAQMNARHRRSYNILKNPIKNIASQVVSSMEEIEMKRFIEELCEMRTDAEAQSSGGTATSGQSTKYSSL